MAEYRYSIEQLTHFQCSICHKWWSIGDAPERAWWFCPWCGRELTTGQPALPLETPPVSPTESQV